MLKHEDIVFRTIPEGPWGGPLADGVGAGHTVVVVRGLIMREMQITNGRGALQLFGADDALPAREPEDALRGEVAWRVLTEARIGILPLRRLDRDMAANLVQRMSRQLDHAAHQQAILQLSRVEDRIAALYWQFAKRWGIATPDGLLVEVHLRHDVIGQLVGSRRSTVSTGLAALARRGVLRETDRGMVLAFAGDPDDEYGWLADRD